MLNKFKSRWIGSMAVALVAGLASTHSASAVSFSDFSDLSDFTLNGSAGTIGNPVFFNGRNVLRLTNALSQGGSAFLTNSIALQDGDGFQASFSTAFEMQISRPQGASDGDGQGADGIVFVVQTNASTVGGTGGGIGYLGIGNSVGIEFDTWNNGDIDGNNGNHIGVDLNGNTSSVVRSNIAQRMNDGDILRAWVDYDGPNDLLEVRFTINDAARPGAALITHSVDLVSVLGQADAFIGFTSGTGAAGGDHDIRAWEFVNTFAPIGVSNGAVPEPITATLGLMGLATLGMVTRRRMA